MVDDKSIEKELTDLASKYDNLDLQNASYDEERGQLQMTVGVRGGPVSPELPPEAELLSQESAADLIGENPILPANYSQARTLLELDPLTRSDLDLLKPSVLQDSPQAIYQRSIDYYRSRDVYGTHINVLTNFASKGFENDIDDPKIKDFYDNWGIDVGLDDFVDKVFFDFFRVGLVRTYKVLGNYKPGVNFLRPSGSIPRKAKAGKESGIAKNRFSKSFIPLRYTILNPTAIVIKGSLMFGQTATFLKKEAGKEIKELLEMKRSELSDFQKKIIDHLPADFKRAVLKGEDIPLDPNLIGEVDYRRMPYERYPLPRASRAFESVEFKDELRKADYSTLDGITNYILLIRVGNDAHPVKKQETLERASELFDTVSKSYKVVWNHTLEVDKITSPEIGEILGPDKYRQVNGDITGGIGMIRALIDGLGEVSPAASELAVKSIIEEINYARRQVSRWIYNEYKQVAEVVGFDRIPRVRFDDMALRDEIQMMSIVQGMIDRRIISYRTGQKKLGFDPDTELAQMELERPLVADGTLGLVGSPFQQSGVQPNQGTPSGTPSEGRPRGKPAKTPKDKDDPTVKASLQVEVKPVDEILASLSLEQLEELVAEVKKKKVTVDLDGDGTGVEEEETDGDEDGAKKKKKRKKRRKKRNPVY